jgi:hypothetical protein
VQQKDEERGKLTSGTFFCFVAVKVRLEEGSGISIDSTLETTAGGCARQNSYFGNIDVEGAHQAHIPALIACHLYGTGSNAIRLHLNLLIAQLCTVQLPGMWLYAIMITRKASVRNLRATELGTFLRRSAGHNFFLSWSKGYISPCANT